VVEEICFLLKLNEPSTHQVIEFYKTFSSMETHSFRKEVIIRQVVDYYIGMHIPCIEDSIR
jgi:hypothetical protein